MSTLVETYQGRTATYGITDLPVGQGYDQFKFVNRRCAEILVTEFPQNWSIPGWKPIVKEKKMSWITSFLTVLHAVEAANTIAAPIVAAVIGGPDGAAIAGMMNQGNAAAVGIEAISATLTVPMTGDQKKAVVDAGTNATFALINSILASQGKPPLPATVPAAVATGVKSVVEGLKTVGVVVGPLPGTNPPTA